MVGERLRIVVHLHIGETDVVQRNYQILVHLIFIQVLPDIKSLLVQLKRVALVTQVAFIGRQVIVTRCNVRVVLVFKDLFPDADALLLVIDAFRVLLQLGQRHGNVVIGECGVLVLVPWLG